MPTFFRDPEQIFCPCKEYFGSRVLFEVHPVRGTESRPWHEKMDKDFRERHCLISTDFTSFFTGEILGTICQGPFDSWICPFAMKIFLNNIWDGEGAEIALPGGGYGWRPRFLSSCSTHPPIPYPYSAISSQAAIFSTYPLLQIYLTKSSPCPTCAVSYMLSTCTSRIFNPIGCLSSTSLHFLPIT